MFFCAESGDGRVYQQQFNPTANIWNEPTLVAQGPKKSGYKAQRFSKFASAPYSVNTTKLLLLYFINESGDLQELVGYPNGSTYYWKANVLGESGTVPSNSFLGVSQRDGETILIFRDDARNVCILKGTARDSKNNYEATWVLQGMYLSSCALQMRTNYTFIHSHDVSANILFVLAAVVVRGDVSLDGSSKLLRDSPLAIVHRYQGQLLTCFFVVRKGRDKMIYSQDIVNSDKTSLNPIPRVVGKLDSNSILGAASFSKNPVYDARLFSVSNLDGDYILVDRVPKFIYQTLYWVIAGGVVDTDVDPLSPVARSTTVA